MVAGRRQRRRFERQSLRRGKRYPRQHGIVLVHRRRFGTRTITNNATNGLRKPPKIPIGSGRPTKGQTEPEPRQIFIGRETALLESRFRGKEGIDRRQQQQAGFHVGVEQQQL